MSEAAIKLGDGLLEACREIEAGLAEHAARRLGPAERHLLRALELFEHEQDRRQMGTALAHLARVDLDYGRLGEAASRSRDAIGLLRGTGDRRVEALSLATIGVSHMMADRRESAAAVLEQALSIARDIGSPAVEAQVLLHRGQHEASAARWSHALEPLQHARELSRRAGQVAIEGRALALLAIVLTELGELALARANAAAAARCEPGGGDLVFGGLVALAGGHVELARERSEPDGEDASSARRVLVARAVETIRTSAESSWELRFGLRLLERALEAMPASEVREPNAPVARGEYVLELAAGAKWFRLGAGRTVELGRRRALRTVLEQLAQRHRRMPEDTLAVRELFEVAWPDETATADVMANRVFAAVASLRRMGLRRVIVRSHDGYQLDPAVRLVAPVR